MDVGYLLHIFHIRQTLSNQNRFLNIMASSHVLRLHINNAMFGCLLYFHEMTPIPTKKTRTPWWITGYLHFMSNLHCPGSSDRIP